MVLRKHELEFKLGEESHLIKAGVLRDDNPLEVGDDFNNFLFACRQGDLRKCQEYINLGVNINGKDKYDYTALIIASLCGHYDLVRVLLEADPGALAERNTFQGERCIYNALNDRIRNLLLKYDFSKSSDPYVYWSSHISSLMNRSAISTSDITLTTDSRSFELHKFILACRSPYFRKKLDTQPNTAVWKLAPTIPVEALQIVLRYIYLGDIPKDLAGPGSTVSEDEILMGLDKISKQLEVEQLWEAILAGNDRRMARQRYEDEVARARGQIGDFFQAKILGHKVNVDTDRVDDVKWDHHNSIFADVLLRADVPAEEEEATTPSQSGVATPQTNGNARFNGIPIGPALEALPSEINSKPIRKSVLYPAHKSMLIRSEYFATMFSGDFVESQKSESLRIITVDCSPPVLELILSFLYTESTACPLEHALDLLYAADMLFLDTLKTKAAVAINTLGSGNKNALVDRTHIPKDANNNGDGTLEVEPINIYDVVHAAWDLRIQRLEEFAARYLAHRLEDYIDEIEFQELIQESASRLKQREETDSIELLDDIRYYLSERFRFRFEDVGIEEMMDEEATSGDPNADNAAATNPPQPDEIQSIETAEIESQRTTATTSNNEVGVQTLDGKTAEDEFTSDAINYQLLLDKIDAMLDRLQLDA